MILFVSEKKNTVELLVDLNIVAKGEFPKPKLVHGHVLLENEEYILIKDVFEDLTHPTYGYPLEIHSFVAWPVKDLNY